MVPTNSDDILDSRDVIKRIRYLEIGEPDEDEQEELKALLALQEEAEGYSPDWHYGATLIRESHFKRYAQELAEETGALDANAPWPMTCIDWAQAAEELAQDYTTVDFDGVSYLIR